MYTVFKNKRPGTPTKFTTYELARQWVRRQIRRKGVWLSSITTNPPIGEYGYEIRRLG